MRPQYTPAQARAAFWSKVDKHSGHFWNGTECWEWTGARQPNGYGRVGFLGRGYLVHRLAYQLAHGTLLPGMQVCHHCDNRACVRDEHLFAGTQTDNEADKIAKGRHRTKLTVADIREIRRLVLGGMSQTRVARRFGTYQANISAIVLGKSWRHVS
jgi:hypothetical protein